MIRILILLVVLSLSVVSPLMAGGDDICTMHQDSWKGFMNSFTEMNLLNSDVIEGLTYALDNGFSAFPQLHTAILERLGEEPPNEAVTPDLPKMVYDACRVIASANEELLWVDDLELPPDGQVGYSIHLANHFSSMNVLRGYGGSYLDCSEMIFFEGPQDGEITSYNAGGLHGCALLHHDEDQAMPYMMVVIDYNGTLATYLLDPVRPVATHLWFEYALMNW